VPRGIVHAVQQRGKNGRDVAVSGFEKFFLELGMQIQNRANDIFMVVHGLRSRIMVQEMRSRY
jgi:hypothetical protein